METPTYYSILTAEVRYSKELSDFEKILYSDITCLTNSKGLCTASNAYFAEAFDKSTSTISRCISNIEKAGFINVRIVYKEGTKEIEYREITLCAKMSIGIAGNGNTPIRKNEDTPIRKNAQDNNTSNNNTSNNIIKKNTKKDFTLEVEEKLSSYTGINLSAFYEWMAYKNYKNIAGVTKVLNMLSKYDHATQQSIVDNSIMNNYQGLFPPKQNFNASSRHQTSTNVDFALKHNVWDAIAMNSERNNTSGVINA